MWAVVGAGNGRLDEDQIAHRWRNLFTLTGATAADNTGTGLLATLYPSLAATFRLGSSELGVAVALGRLASLPFGPLSVALSSRLGRRTVLVASVALGGTVICIGASARTFLGILVVQILLSASVAGVLPIAQTVIADSFDDRHRSRAVGCFFGVSTLLAASLGPLFALWVRLPEGWRWSMRTAGVACVACALLIAVLYREPRTGGAEQQLADVPPPPSGRTGSNRASVAALLRVPTFVALMVSRLLSGHALIVVFGVQFLVSERGFSNVGAAVVVLPYGVGYFAGALAGGWLVTLVHARAPRRGRIVVLQAAQLGFAAVAYTATQVIHDTLFVYASCCLVMGALQAINPVVNRPLVMAVVVPEIRGQAFAVFGIVDTGTAVILTALGGVFGEVYGLTAVFRWVLVVAIAANAIWLSVLHLTYPQDRVRLAGPWTSAIH